MKYTITAIIFFSISNIFFAQVKDLQFTFRNGNAIYNSYILKLVYDSVLISNSKTYRWVKVNSITEIKKTKNSKVLQNVTYGLVSGAVIGGIINLAEDTDNNKPNNFYFDFHSVIDIIDSKTIEGVVLGGFAGALVGGIIGLSSDKDKVYDLSHKTLKEKLYIIQLIKRN